MMKHAVMLREQFFDPKFSAAFIGLHLIRAGSIWIEALVTEPQHQKLVGAGVKIHEIS